MEQEKKGIGEFLRERRLALGLEIEELAKRTKISKRFLEALENEDWQAFPAEVYLKGYLRCYAETLGLDPSEVLLKYESVVDKKVFTQDPASSAVLGGDSSRSYLLWILLFLAVAGAIVLYFTLIK